jgi:type III secretion system YopN/LcrE/InvE/MxiC family regulator
MAINIRGPAPLAMPMPRIGTQVATASKQTAHQNISKQGVTQQGVRQQLERQSMGEASDSVRDAVAPENRSLAAQMQDLVDASANMAAARGFRGRLDFDKKADQTSDHFERALDEEAHPKAQQILKVAKTIAVSGDELLRQARSLFPDISDLIIVLRELLRRRQLDEVVRVRLQKALAQAESEAPPRALKAGINIALKARLFGAKLALSALLLRASYRQFLESEAAEVVIYEEWVTSYGPQRRALVMEFLESALVADMLAQDPSCSRIEFGNLLGKLNQLKLLRSSESLFIDSMLNDPVTRAHNHSETDWLVFMLALMQAPQELDALLTDTVGEQILLSSHATRSRLLQTIRHACHALPQNLFVEQDEIGALWERFEDLAAVSYRHELMALRSGSGEDDGDNDDDDNNDNAEHDHVR